MNQEAYIEAIHRYLDGTMGEQEKAEFKSAMAKDINLKNDMQTEQKLLRSLQIVGDNDLRQTIRQTQNELERKGFFSQNEKGETAGARVISIQKILAYAAVLVLLVAAGIWLFNQQKQPDTEAIYSNYFKPETEKVSEIIASLPSGFTGALNASDSLKAGLTEYEAGNFAESKTWLKDIIQRYPENDNARFYLALVYMNDQDWKSAIDLLLPISEKENALFKWDAAWYLGLSYLKTEANLDKAKTIFSTLAQEKNYPNRLAAQSILDQLEN